MNTQNILKSFGSLLDVKVDGSQYYDFDLAKTQNDYDKTLFQRQQDIAEPCAKFY